MISESIEHARHARARIDAALSELAWAECDRACYGEEVADADHRD